MLRQRGLWELRVPVVVERREMGRVMESTIHGSNTQQIWSEFGDRLRAFIARRVDSEADADDILQEVFLRIHQHAGSVKRSDRLTSWLFQVTRNAITDYYRAPARREQPESVAGVVARGRTTLAVPAVDFDLDAAQVRAELASCLRPMVERLPPPYREAVALVDLAGVPQTEAAARQGLSISGMKSRVQRGRRALKDILVDCCPVQLDTTGRIVDYDRPDPACTTCAGSGEVATLIEEPGNDCGCCRDSVTSGIRVLP
jgi:RNA polymerase sigma-70 factor (ECF subfamily)